MCHAVYARYDGGHRQAHRILKAFGWTDHIALEDDTRSHRLHGEDPDVSGGQFRKDIMFKTSEMSIHCIKRHLHGIEPEAVFPGCFEHPEMDVRVLVSRKTYKPYLSGFARFDQCLERSAGENILSGSSSRITSWICTRSITSV